MSAAGAEQSIGDGNIEPAPLRAAARALRPRTLRRVASVGVATAIGMIAMPVLAFGTGQDLADIGGANPVKFPGDTIYFQLYSEVPPTLSLVQVDNAIVSAAETWMQPQCSAVKFVDEGTTEISAAEGDGENTIEWVNDWAARGFDSQAAAFTDVQYVKGADGRWSIA